MSSTNSYSSIRKYMIQYIIKFKKKNRAQPPIVPYLGIYLTDLTFIEDGNPDFIDHTTIKTIKKFDDSIIDINNRIEKTHLAKERLGKYFLFIILNNSGETKYEEELKNLNLELEKLNNSKQSIDELKFEIKDVDMNKQLIHWTKRKFVYGVISQIQVYQNKFYDILPVYQIQQLIEKTFESKFITDDKSLFDISLSRESRNAVNNNLRNEIIE
jgi:hypothetical protein